MASFARQIPAGGRDKISVVVHTDGNGGETIEKRFHVATNDPRNPRAQLLVVGKINPLIQVTPPFVRIVGHAGPELTAMVELQPAPDHPFTVLEAGAWRQDELGVGVEPLGQDPARDGYNLVVRSLKTEPGVYRNYIIIKTDLKEKTRLNIPVYIRIYAEGEAEETGPQQ